MTQLDWVDRSCLFPRGHSIPCMLGKAIVSHPALFEDRRAVVLLPDLSTRNTQHSTHPTLVTSRLVHLHTMFVSETCRESSSNCSLTRRWYHTPAATIRLLLRTGAGTVSAHFDRRFCEPIAHVKRFLANCGVIFSEGLGDADTGWRERLVRSPVADLGVRRDTLDGGEFAWARV